MTTAPTSTTEHSGGPLRAEQIEVFIEQGFTILSEAFPRSTAEAVRQALGRRIGIDLDDPMQWTQPRVWLKEGLTTAPFIDALTARFVAGVDQLVGAGRWRLRQDIGWWPVTFPGFNDPPYGNDWHVEGDFRHHVWSPEQAILPLFCFSDVGPGGGGTLLAVGSHHLAAEMLWEAEPAGLGPDDIWPEMNRRLDQHGWDIVEVAARTGDVILAHPLVFHSSNPNRGDRPRVMAQPRYDMTGPKRTGGDNLSPVELAIARNRPGAGR